MGAGAGPTRALLRDGTIAKWGILVSRPRWPQPEWWAISFWQRCSPHEPGPALRPHGDGSARRTALRLRASASVRPNAKPVLAAQRRARRYAQPAMGDWLGFCAAARGHAPDVAVTAHTSRGIPVSDLVQTQASRVGSRPFGRPRGGVVRIGSPLGSFVVP